jgi:hypothetical protein
VSYCAFDPGSLKLHDCFASCAGEPLHYMWDHTVHIRHVHCITLWDNVLLGLGLDARWHT